MWNEGKLYTQFFDNVVIYNLPSRFIDTIVSYSRVSNFFITNKFTALWFKNLLIGSA